MPSFKEIYDALFKKEDLDKKINQIINNVILDKLSFLESSVKENEEDTQENLKVMKNILTFGNEEHKKELDDVNKRVEKNSKDTDKIIKIITQHYGETTQNKKGIEENTEDIEELIRITEIHQQEVSNDNRKTKKLFMNIFKGMKKIMKEQRDEIDVLNIKYKTLEKENEILNDKLDVIYEMLKKNKK